MTDDKQTIKDLIEALQASRFANKQLRSTLSQLEQGVEELKRQIRTMTEELDKRDMLALAQHFAILHLEDVASRAMATMQRISEQRKAKDCRWMAEEWLNAVSEPRADLSARQDELLKRDEELRRRKRQLDKREEELKKRETR